MITKPTTDEAIEIVKSAAKCNILEIRLRTGEIHTINGDEIIAIKIRKEKVINTIPIAEA